MTYIKMMILGRSGSGKTTSLRNLDPKQTGIINADKESFPFPSNGFRTIKDAKGLPDLSKSNYVETGKPSSMLKCLKTWDERQDIKTIVVDTITHLFTEYYVTQALGKDYGGYKEMGTSFWDVMDNINKLNTNVIVFGHIQYTFNDMGDKVISMKSHGKMIESFEPESYFNTLLLAEVIKEEGTLKWVFRTKPKETFEKIKSPSTFIGDKVVSVLDYYEDNDINAILNKLNKFYS